MNYGFGELDFFVGDIWELATQAFVCPITDDLRPVVGIGAGIVRRAGPEIAKELVDRDPIDLGQAFVTEAGTLQSKWLIHTSICTLASSTTGPELIEALDAAFNICQHSAIKSVAIPAMCIDPGELGVKIVANIIVSACFRSFKMSRLPERVVIVVPHLTSKANSKISSRKSSIKNTQNRFSACGGKTLTAERRVRPTAEPGR